MEGKNNWILCIYERSNVNNNYTLDMHEYLHPNCFQLRTTKQVITKFNIQINALWNTLDNTSLRQSSIMINRMCINRVGSSILPRKIKKY